MTSYKRDPPKESREPVVLQDDSCGLVSSHVIGFMSINIILICTAYPHIAENMCSRTSALRKTLK